MLWNGPVWHSLIVPEHFFKEEWNKIVKTSCTKLVGSYPEMDCCITSKMFLSARMQPDHCMFFFFFPLKILFYCICLHMNFVGCYVTLTGEKDVT